MKKLLAILGLLSIVFTAVLKPQPAKAADDQMHLYGSAFMAMASGIHPDYAIAMSLGNEMIDRGIWTTPMGLPTPRLLFHFLGTPADFNVDEGIIRRGLAIATIKHPLFYNLLHKGMLTKNPVDLGKALHLLTDTFYHAGYSNLLGHGEGGHRPDMPYDEILKARLCFQAIVEVLFIIRDMQPGPKDFSVLKRIVEDVSKNPAYESKLKVVTGANTVDGIVEILARRPDLFTQVVLDHPQVRNTFFTTMERTPGYRKLSMKEIFGLLIKKGYTTLKPQDFAELATQFRDLSARTDLMPMDSTKIVIYRFLQLQDPMLKQQAAEELKTIGYDAAEMKAILDRGHFDFSTLAGFDDMKGLNAEINTNYIKHIDSLRFITTNLETFMSQITEIDSNGKKSFLPSSRWPQDVRTFADTLLPDMLAWTRIINHGGAIRLEEHRDIGNLFSTQTDAEAVISSIDRDPSYLENTVEILKGIESNAKTLKTAARLRALAEIARSISYELTKDMFPMKTSADHKANFENDKLSHAVFAKESRIMAARNLITEFFNIDILRGPDPFHVFVKQKMQAGFTRIKGKVPQVVAQVDAQVAEIMELAREFNHSIGFGQKNADGKIELPIDRPDVFRVAPNLSLSGYLSWTMSTFQYVGRVMLKRAQSKNAAIMGYVSNGEKMKSEVVQQIERQYYKPTDSQKSNLWNLKFGEMNSRDEARKSKVTGLPGIVRCESLHIRAK